MKKWSLNGILVFSIIYFAIALLGRFVFHKEIFPFYHWSLYSSIPQNITSVQLVLISENGKQVDERNLLSKKEKLFATPIEVNTVLQSYFYCYVNNCEDLKKKESLLLNLIPSNCKINVVKKEHDDLAVIAVINNKTISYVQ